MSDFIEHLERCSEIVYAWPAWKQAILGGPVHCRLCRGTGCASCSGTGRDTKSHPWERGEQDPSNPYKAFGEWQDWIDRKMPPEFVNDWCNVPVTLRAILYGIMRELLDGKARP